MSIAEIVSPLNMTGFKADFRVNYNIDHNVQLPNPPIPPQPYPNPFNSRSDGLLTTVLFGGIAGKNTAKIVFDEPSITEGTSTKTALLKNTGINMGVGAAVYGGLSVIKQGIGLATGKQDAAGAMANLSADLLRGGASGLGASIGGGLTGFAMQDLGATGTFGMVTTFIGGMIGSSVGTRLIEATDIRHTLAEKFGSKKLMVA